MKKKTERQKTVKALDIAFSRYIKARDGGKCVYCGCEGVLHLSHVVPRRYLDLRWDDKNAIVLCVRHHLYYWHKDVIAAAEWFKLRFPDRWGYLMDKKGQPSRKWTISMLKDKLNEYVL